MFCSFIHQISTKKNPSEIEKLGTGVTEKRGERVRERAM